MIALVLPALDSEFSLIDLHECQYLQSSALVVVLKSIGSVVVLLVRIVSISQFPVPVRREPSNRLAAGAAASRDRCCYSSSILRWLCIQSYDLFVGPVQVAA